MKYFTMMLVLLGFSVCSLAQPQPAPGDTFTMTIENNGQVSPGGWIKIKVVGTPKIPSDVSTKGARLRFTERDESFLNASPGHDLEWDYGSSITEPRYAKIWISDKIDPLTLPTTMVLNLHKSYHEGSTILASAQIFLVAGTHGHDTQFKGRYLKSISGKGTVWYELYCISDGVSQCRIDIKDGEYDKYTGRQPINTKHTCSDSGFPLATIGIRESVVFDISKLIKINTGDHNLDTGTNSHDTAICNFISSSPFLIRKVGFPDVAQKR